MPRPPKSSRSPKSSKAPKRSKPSTSRKSATRPKRAAKRSKPSTRTGSRRPARSSKPQRKAKAPARRTKPAKTPRSPVKSASRKAATRPASSPKKGLRVVLFGAGGMVGSRIAKEALARGHKVVAVQRNPGGLDLDGRHLMTVQGDATDPASVERLAKGADAVVSAVSPRDPPGVDTLPRAAKALLEGTRKAGVKRLVVVGGAGSLSVGPTARLIDSPQFPDAYRPEAMEHVDALQVYRSQGQGVDWTFVSPPAMVQPGPRTGKYQVGQDDLLTAKDGQSHISAEDYAVALVDELERGENKGRRMTVAWP